MARDLHVAETFPPGTEVALYESSALNAEGVLMPRAEAVQRAKVGSNAVLSFDSLDSDTRYVAIAEVDGRQRRVSFKG